MSDVDDPADREVPLFLRTDLFPEPDENGMVTFYALGGDHRDELP